MVAPTVGSVVLVPFPFSDLSHSKRRPAVLLADAKRGDWILCQITSKPYSDTRAVELTEADFEQGGLRLLSYARPAKLFTAHESLFISQADVLSAASLWKIIDKVVKLFQQSA